MDSTCGDVMGSDVDGLTGQDESLTGAVSVYNSLIQILIAIPHDEHAQKKLHAVLCVYIYWKAQRYMFLARVLQRVLLPLQYHMMNMLRRSCMLFYVFTVTGKPRDICSAPEYCKGCYSHCSTRECHQVSNGHEGTALHIHTSVEVGFSSASLCTPECETGVRG
jgi:hypothetical protein